MIGWLIYNKQDAEMNRSYITWFIDEAKKQQIQLQLIYREEMKIGIQNHQHMLLINNQQPQLPIFAIVRTIEPLLNKHLEYLGIKVFNSSRVAEICNDKAKTHFEIAKMGIPMVDTLFVKSDYLTSTAPMDFPFVIKETTGRGGKQVFFITDKKQWLEFLSSTPKKDYVIQSSDVQLGKDLRTFIVGKEIVGAVLRESNTDFRANYKLGGTASLYELNTTEKAIIEKIISQFDFGMVGIDFLIGKDGQLLFNEIEDVVGSRTLSAVSDINILEKYMTHIKETINQDS